MKGTGKKVLAAKIVSFCLILATINPSLLIGSGIPVFDGANMVQTTISALQNVAAVAKQVQQYQTQLQQYQNMLQNTLTPSNYIWDQASQTISNLLSAQDTLSYYKQQIGSISQYLDQYKDLNYYLNSSYFSPQGGSATDRQAILTANSNAYEARKKANDAVLMNVDQQQTALVNDASNLQRLQQQANGVQGQLEAIQAANQFASAQNNQLLQIRSILIAQQNAEATRQQAIADKEAQQAAAAQQIRDQANITQTSSTTWTY
jgi:P-type conjugative transfer protein TrbJ